MPTSMKCRTDCGACCIAPSISSPLPGMPEGKAAGEICVNLDLGSMRCLIWGTPDYPEVCRRFEPSTENCGATRSQALTLLSALEHATAPD